MKNIVQSAKNIKQEIIDVRRAIHKTPEVGKSLPKTKELVDTILVHENGNIMVSKAAQIPPSSSAETTGIEKSRSCIRIRSVPSFSIRIGSFSFQR